MITTILFVLSLLAVLYLVGNIPAAIYLKRKNPNIVSFTVSPIVYVIPIVLLVATAISHTLGW